MTIRTRHIAAFAVASLALLLAVATPCAADDDHEEALRAVRSGAVLPLRKILDIAKGQFDGEMLEAELEREHGDWIYEIEMISPRGSVFKLEYGAADGTLLDGKGHGLMRAYRGDPATLPESLRHRHERMMERWAERGGRGEGERHRHGGWWGRLWGDDERGPGPAPGERE